MSFNPMPSLTVTKVASANRLLTSPVGVWTTRKMRKQWALVLKRQGKTYYDIAGREVLSDRHHPVILPKGSHYRWTCTEPGECLLIEFDTLTEISDTIFSFETADPGFFVHTFSKIEKSLLHPSPQTDLECKHLLYGLLVSLCDTQTRSYVPKGRQNILQPALDYIFANYFRTQIANDYLAGLCGVSTVYFRKLFKETHGVSPIRYLHDLRISKAKDILRSDYESIEQVAESVGYSSLYHFSKMFRTYTGMSPSEYAKASRK